MDDWKRFNETSLPKEDFYSHLNMEELMQIMRAQKES